MIYFMFPEGRTEKKLFINKDSLQVQICINLKKGKNGVAQQVTFTAGEDPLKVQYHCQLLTYLIHTYFSLPLSLHLSLESTSPLPSPSALGYMALQLHSWQS